MTIPLMINPRSYVVTGGKRETLTSNNRDKDFRHLGQSLKHLKTGVSKNLVVRNKTELKLNTGSLT